MLLLSHPHIREWGATSTHSIVSFTSRACLLPAPAYFPRLPCSMQLGLNTINGVSTVPDHLRKKRQPAGKPQPKKAAAPAKPAAAAAAANGTPKNADEKKNE